MSKRSSAVYSNDRGALGRRRFPGPLAVFLRHARRAYQPVPAARLCRPAALRADRRSRAASAQHPHRGFETVTIVYEGEVEHRDSDRQRRRDRSGRRAVDDGGGRASCTRSSTRRTSPRPAGTLEMVQLWVNLPAKDKMAPPATRPSLDADIPVGRSAGRRRQGARHRRRASTASAARRGRSRRSMSGTCG